MATKDQLCIKCTRPIDFVGGGYHRDAQGIVTCVECKHGETQEKLSRFTDDMQKGLGRDMSINPVVLAQKQIELLELILMQLQENGHPQPKIQTKKLGS